MLRWDYNGLDIAKDMIQIILIYLWSFMLSKSLIDHSAGPFSYNKYQINILLILKQYNFHILELYMVHVYNNINWLFEFKLKNKQNPNQMKNSSLLFKPNKAAYPTPKQSQPKQKASSRNPPISQSCQSKIPTSSRRSLKQQTYNSQKPLSYHIPQKRLSSINNHSNQLQIVNDKRDGNRNRKIYRNNSTHISRNGSMMDLISNNSSANINHKQNFNKKKRPSKNADNHVPSIISHTKSLNPNSHLISSQVQPVICYVPANSHVQSVNQPIQSVNQHIQSVNPHVQLINQHVQSVKSSADNIKLNDKKNINKQIICSIKLASNQSKQLKSKQIVSNVKTQYSQKLFTTQKRQTKFQWLKIIHDFYLQNYLSVENLDKIVPTNSSHKIKFGNLILHLQQINQKNQHKPITNQRIKTYEQNVTLNQIVLFIKNSLKNDFNINRSTVGQEKFINKSEIESEKSQIKHVKSEIKYEKCKLSFNDIGKIMFSKDKILTQIQRPSKQNIQPTPKINQTSIKPTQKNTSIMSKKSSQEINQSNLQSIILKQDDQIVQTARFQNNQHSYSLINHSSKKNIQKSSKRKQIHQVNNQIYRQNVDQLIYSKLSKPNLTKNTSNKEELIIAKNKRHPSTSTIIQNSFCSQTQNKTYSQHLSQGSNQSINYFAKKNPKQMPYQTPFYPTTSYPTPSYSTPSNSTPNQINPYHQPVSQQSFIQNSLIQLEQSNKQVIDVIAKNSNKLLWKQTPKSNLIDSQYKLHTLHMNSSKYNLYKSNQFNASSNQFNISSNQFNISFNDDLGNSSFQLPQHKNDSLFYQQSQMINTQIQTINRQMTFDQIVKEIQFINNQMKSFFTGQSKFINSTINKATKDLINIQDVTQIDQFLTQFTDYKVFKRVNNNSKHQNYFYAIQLTQSNLSTRETNNVVQKILLSNLIRQYFSSIQAIRVFKSSFFISSIDKIMQHNSCLKILNLSYNGIQYLGSINKIIQKNLNHIEFINLSGNRISSIKELLLLVQFSKFTQLKQLHLKSNCLQCLCYPSTSLTEPNFPSLQLMDLRSNNVSSNQISNLKKLIQNSPSLGILSLKQNPLMNQDKIESFNEYLSDKSIYQYQSLQIMSMFIQYKQITFSDSNQNCCSLIIQQNQFDQQDTNTNKIIQITSSTIQIHDKQHLIYHINQQKCKKQPKQTKKNNFSSLISY